MSKHVCTETGAKLKPTLQKIAIFGANGRIGNEVARSLQANDKPPALRLIVRSESHVAALKEQFPSAEIAIANYYNLESLRDAFSGVDGIFLVTPNRLDEERAMPNVVAASREHAGKIKHIIRLLGDPPGMSMDRVPDNLRNAPGGTAIQHILAKRILLQSRLPITYVNIAAYFMQNFSGPLFSLGLRKFNLLSCPRNRLMAYIDTVDIGRCCAALLLSDDQRHIGQTYHLDNGTDVLRFDEVADLMSEVWGEQIRFDGSDETFVNLKHSGDPETPPPAPLPEEDYWVRYSKFEQQNQTAWRRTDIVESLTGSPAKSLRDWLTENKDAVLQSDAMPRVY